MVGILVPEGKDKEKSLSAQQRRLNEVMRSPYPKALLLVLAGSLLAMTVFILFLRSPVQDAGERDVRVAKVSNAPLIDESQFEGTDASLHARGSGPPDAGPRQLTEHELNHHHRSSARVRNFSIDVVSWEPRIFLLRNLWTKDEVAEILRYGVPRLERSTVSVGDKSVESTARTSYGAWIGPESKEIIEAERRIALATQLSRAHQEDFYLLRYEIGQEYKPHHDYFDPAVYPVEKWVGKAGQRIASVVSYLSHPDQGGETYFPHLGIEIMPEVGDAVLFWDLKPNLELDPLTMHGSHPVVSGTKYVATKWIHTDQFRPHIEDLVEDY